MISQRIMAFFQGYLVVMITGYHCEKFISLALTSGVTFWDVNRKTPKRFILNLSAQDYPILRPYFYRTGTKGKILRRKGAPFLWRRVRAKKGWLLGMLCFMLTINILSSFIWFVEVTGVQEIEKTRILQDLSDLGLYPGVLRSKIEKKRDWMLKELRMRLPEAVWVSIRLKGVVSLVTVTEKTLPPPAVRNDANLVAAKDGLITSLLVIEGTPLVHEGDMVSRGDVLILGEKSLQHLDGSIEIKKVRAEGKIIARVWEEIIIEEPLEVYRPVITSGQRVVYSLRIKNRLFPMFSRGKLSGRFSQTRSGKTILRGRNRLSLVELIKDRYQTIDWNPVVISPEIALTKAKIKGEERMAFLLPSGLKPLSTKEEWEVTEGILKYRLVVEAQEDIAAPELKEEKK